MQFSRYASPDANFLGLVPQDVRGLRLNCQVLLAESPFLPCHQSYATFTALKPEAADVTLGA